MKDYMVKWRVRSAHVQAEGVLPRIDKPRETEQDEEKRLWGAFVSVVDRVRKLQGA